MIEILVVVAIIGFAGAIVVPHMLSAGSLGVQAAARTVISDILFTQNDAVAAGKPRRIVFDAANDRYWVTADTSFDMAVVPAPTNAINVAWKGGATGVANYFIDFGTDDRFDGVAINNAVFGTHFAIEFDALGSPSNGGSVDVVFGNTTLRVSVAPFTGRVTVAQVAITP